MTRALVKYIGGGSRPKRTNITWGGTTATNAAYLAAFKDDPEYKVVTRFREDFAEKDRLALALAFLDGADITHIDDTSIVALMLNAGVATRAFPTSAVAGMVTVMVSSVVMR